MSSQTYWELLKRPEWQKRRLDMLNKFEFHCSVCGDNETSLHVHHKRYVKGRKPWEYEDFELAVLCEGCHSYAHEEDNRLKEMFCYLRLDGPQSNVSAMAFIAGYCRSQLPDELVERDFDLTKTAEYAMGDFWDNVERHNGYGFADKLKKSNLNKEDLMSLVGMVIAYYVKKEDMDSCIEAFRRM